MSDPQQLPATLTVIRNRDGDWSDFSDTTPPSRARRPDPLPLPHPGKRCNADRYTPFADREEVHVSLAQGAVLRECARRALTRHRLPTASRPPVLREADRE